MDVQAFRVLPSMRFERVPCDEFLRCRNEAGEYFWVEVSEPSAPELAGTLAPLDLHPLVVERCVDEAASSGSLLFERHILVQIAWQKSWDDLERHLLSIICLPREIVLVHSQADRLLATVSHDLPVLLAQQQLETSSILYALVDRIVDESVELGLLLRRAVDRLDADMQSDTAEDAIGAVILRMRRLASNFEITLEEQHRCLTSLLPVDNDVLQAAGLHHYFRDVISHLEHGLRSVEGVHARLAELHQSYQLVLQDRTNRRLKLLTIVTAIFMPLSLVTGIYGMNFRFMPELGWPYAYPAVLFLMAGIACGLLWFFYRRGWFD